MINIDLSNFIIVALVIFLVVRLFPPTIYVLKKVYLYRLFQKNNLKKYLNVINNEIGKVNSKFRDKFLLEKAVVLFLNGEFIDSIKALKMLNLERLSYKDKPFYCYYLILALFEIGNFEEAKNEYEKYHDILSNLKKSKKYKVAAYKLDVIKSFNKIEDMKNRQGRK